MMSRAWPWNRRKQSNNDQIATPPPDPPGFNILRQRLEEAKALADRLEAEAEEQIVRRNP